MSERKLHMTRREMLRVLGLGAAGTVVAACSTPTPQIIEKTVIVKETVAVEVEKVVEKTVVVEKTSVVEKAITATPGPAKKIELSMWASAIWRYGKDCKTPDAPPDEFLLDAAARFNKLYPNITVKPEILTGDAGSQKSAAAWASGNLPNITYGGPGISSVQAGFYEALDDYLTPEVLADWASGLQTLATFFGKIYGMPGFLNPNFFVLNKTALEVHGGAEFLPTEPMRDLTFATFEKMATAFTDNKTRYFYGIPQEHGSGIFWAYFNQWQGFGVDVWDANQEKWMADTDEAAAAIQYLQDGMNKGWIMPNLPKWGDVDTFYWAKNCAARGQWPGIYAELAVAKSQGAAADPFELFWCPFPHADNVPGWYSPGGGITWTVNRTKDPDARKASVDFLTWFAQDKSNAPCWMINGFYPAYKSAMTSIKDMEIIKDSNNQWVLNTWMQKYSAEKPGQGMNWWPALNERTGRLFGAKWGDIYSMFNQLLQSLLTNKTTGKEVVTQLGKAINDALKG